MLQHLLLAEKARIGCEIVGNLMAQAETKFGASVLEDGLICVGDRAPYALINALTLFRHIQRRQRLYAVSLNGDLYFIITMIANLKLVVEFKVSRCARF